MDKEFCKKCGKPTPECAIFKLPQNIKFEELIKGSSLNYQECLVCHKNAQSITDKLEINKMCDECGLCQFACPAIINEWNNEISRAIETIIIKDFVKLAILLKSLFPKSVVGTEVHVKGNFRTKRIDVVVIQEKRIVFIKVLANIDKIPLYSRSYEDVKEFYEKEIQREIIPICLIPENKKSIANKFEHRFCTLMELIEYLEA